ncbi:uncharacterized protein LOC113238331 [Hyposmocoma kahamanoa]|uniref:uncharacterized protein LOC113238331 n=1 Tax=Hyposmocoma kahamanoa TaxID=1477025 RepID=UPI000E6D9DCE|nr:uncharacterized protein LOC113238331 [Hyposmocoma kahamanoa]
MSKRSPVEERPPEPYIDYSDYECNLECARQGSFKEFVGPVKIILMETPPEVYKKNMTVSGLVAATYMFFGMQFIMATLFTFNYALPFRYNGHIFYCTSAYQLLFPIGILTYNRFNIVAKHERIRERNIEHGVCQVVGFLCAMYGWKGTFGIGGGTWHSRTGFWANVFLLVVVILSFSNIKKPAFGQERIYLIMSTIHKGCGIISLLLGSICYMTGVTKQNFTAWLRQEIYGYFLAFLCFCSMIVVINDPAKVCIRKIVKFRRGEDISEIDDEELYWRFGEKKKKTTKPVNLSLA